MNLSRVSQCLEILGVFRFGHLDKLNRFQLVAIVRVRIFCTSQNIDCSEIYDNEGI